VVRNREKCFPFIGLNKIVGGEKKRKREKRVDKGTHRRFSPKKKGRDKKGKWGITTRNLSVEPIISFKGKKRERGGEKGEEWEEETCVKMVPFCEIRKKKKKRKGSPNVLQATHDLRQILFFPCDRKKKRREGEKLKHLGPFFSGRKKKKKGRGRGRRRAQRKDDQAGAIQAV